MALRFVPSTSYLQTTQPSFGAPSAPGVHDTLRANLSLSTPAPKAQTSSLEIASSHPLESRLANWRMQQDSLKMEMLRRQFGIAEPVKRGMELHIVRAGEWRPMCLSVGGGGFGMGGGGLHADILAGRDTEIGWEDVFVGDELRDVPDFHTEMEQRFGMMW